MLRLTNRYSGPPHGTGVLPRPVLARLAQTGGIISTRELRSLDVDQVALEVLLRRGALQAVRQGWYCTPATPAVVRLAWRFGGPLACVSAVQFLDDIAGLERDAETNRGPMPVFGVNEPLHVCLRSDAVSPPSPALLARRWRVPEPREPIIHWSTRDYVSGDRRAVSRDVALRQATHCRTITAATPSTADG